MTVVLPLPDSPTMASVSPGATANVARCTARTARLRNQPSRTE